MGLSIQQNGEERFFQPMTRGALRIQVAGDHRGIRMVDHGDGNTTITIEYGDEGATHTAIEIQEAADA